MKNSERKEAAGPADSMVKIPWVAQQEMGIQVSMFRRWKSKEVINTTSVLILFSLLSPTYSNCVVSSHFDWNWILTKSIRNLT